MSISDASFARACSSEMSLKTAEEEFESMMFGVTDDEPTDHEFWPSGGHQEEETPAPAKNHDDASAEDLDQEEPSGTAAKKRRRPVQNGLVAIIKKPARKKAKRDLDGGAIRRMKRRAGISRSKGGEFDDMVRSVCLQRVKATVTRSVVYMREVRGKKLLISTDAAASLRTMGTPMAW